MNSNWSYEIGFEIINSFFRRVLVFDAYDYWHGLLILQVLLAALVYRKTTEALLGFIGLISISYGVLGTQVRYAIFCFVFVLIFRLSKNIIVLILASLFHSGGFIAAFISTVTSYLENKRNIFYHITTPNIFSFSLFAILLCSSLLVTPLITYALTFWERFAYYSGSDTYMVKKSLVSTVYIVLSLFILLYAKVSLVDYNGDTYFDKNLHLIDFSIFLLFTCVLTLDMAVLSGRLLILYMVIEPILAVFLIKYRVTSLLGLSMSLMIGTRAIIHMI
ncbi:hypothetical protein A9264_15330 [Vibrio sp. UCD-FRSSP16_10]|uniref:EpsG family protein n=1 Tax=unclassified Vibrio TaxID=2614977 RepID=UPI000800F14F|nr:MULTISPECIES: EpsG family protein [unclassified Vibrio]OBT19229.1 hypothetical protein A9264_15330 [Vibrio sp. UCD-FRSSP16_10]